MPLFSALAEHIFGNHLLNDQIQMHQEPDPDILQHVSRRGLPNNFRALGSEFRCAGEGRGGGSSSGTTSSDSIGSRRLHKISSAFVARGEFTDVVAKFEEDQAYLADVSAHWEDIREQLVAEQISGVQAAQEAVHQMKDVADITLAKVSDTQKRLGELQNLKLGSLEEG